MKVNDNISMDYRDFIRMHKIMITIFRRDDIPFFIQV